MPRYAPWHTHLAATVRYSWGRLTGHPTLDNLEVTRTCNARCDFCRYWRTRSETRLDDYIPVIRQLRPAAVAVTGGEPFMRGDITDLDIEAFVHDITEDLKLGAGFGSAIQQRGGVAIQKELNAIGRCPVGEAVITNAGLLKAKHIIHVNGPKFREDDEEGNDDVSDIVGDGAKEDT